MAQSIVQDVGFTYLRVLVPVLVVPQGCVQNRRKGRMTETKAELDNWIEDIVAFHKAKRKFVSLKEMKLEDADQFLICEFKGYDFEILAY